MVDDNILTGLSALLNVDLFHQVKLSVILNNFVKQLEECLSIF